jgi:predicted AAA+ superfamily ATPase
VIDEIQKIPALTNEVHRLIEEKKWRFILTGSSARKLKKENANLLGGRALAKRFYPLTAVELGEDFNILTSLEYGHLPAIYSDKSINREAYLESYISVYLREELIQEGIIRNIQVFSRFLEAASFSQASILNMANIAKDVDKDPKVIADYFEILEDLLIGHRLPIFSRKGSRKTITKSKFYFFDVGIYKSLRPSGPLDDPSTLNGHAFETLIFQEILAMNHYLNWGYDISYWHTKYGQEVDFILYGKKGLLAIECKCSQMVSSSDLKNLQLFKNDFKPAKLYLIYGGDIELFIDGVKIIPANIFLKNIDFYLK